MWTRESEDALVRRCVSAATKKMVPSDADEADVFRLAAQMAQTRYPGVAAALEQTSRSFFEKNTTMRPRKFPDVVKAGLVTDLPRFRNLLERQLSGIPTW
jgi:hypothetical protein